MPVIGESIASGAENQGFVLMTIGRKEITHHRSDHASNVTSDAPTAGVVQRNVVRAPETTTYDETARRRAASATAGASLLPRKQRGREVHRLAPPTDILVLLGLANGTLPGDVPIGVQCHRLREAKSLIRRGFMES